MGKRILAAALWFFSMSALYNLVAGLTGLPEAGGPIIGAMVGALVALDPTGTIWPSRVTQE